jgi:hypothetical protein
MTLAARFAETSSPPDGSCHLLRRLIRAAQSLGSDHAASLDLKPSGKLVLDFYGVLCVGL